MVNLTKTGLFMFGLFILGAGLMVCFVNLEKSLPSACTSLNLKNYLKGILVLSIVSITLPISYMLCNMSCKNKNIVGNFESSLEARNKHIVTVIYMLIVFTLGISLIVLAIMIKNELSDVKCDSNNNSALDIIIGLGSVYLFIGVVMLFSTYQTIMADRKVKSK
jgi:hypothetical protein